MSRTGLESVSAALDGLTWRSLSLICALQIVSLALCGLAWWSLTQDASLAACTLARWVRDGTSSVLGFIPGFGEFAGARALKLLGSPGGDAAASTVVDVVTEAVSQAAFTICGLLMLVGLAGANVVVLGLGAVAGAALPAFAIAALSRSPRALNLLDRAISRVGRLFGLGAVASGLDLVANVVRLNQRSDRLALATVLHLAAWFLGAGQVWLAAQALGHPISLGVALAMFSVGYAARGALFFVPMGIGVQELGFVLVGAALGIDEAIATALSLTLRAREVVLGIPATLAWVLGELREAWQVRKGLKAASSSGC